MSDQELQSRVCQELLSDPKLATASIAVAADNGVVTLRGTVRTLRQKLEARRAAERIHGVKNVHNDLDVRPISDNRKLDTELRTDVLQALMLDSLVPSTIDARVREGDRRLPVSARGGGACCDQHRRRRQPDRRDQARASHA